MGRYVLAHELQAGDCIRMGGLRFGSTSSSDTEGVTRIDRVEHLTPGDDVVATGWLARLAQPVVAVFAHGLPGAVLLRPGDHATWAEVPEGQRGHGDQHDWWPVPESGTVFAGARTPSTGSAPERPLTGSAARPTTNANATRRPAVFAKRAHDLAVGDYLRVLGCPDAQEDWDMDEGFAYVSWVAHVDPAVVERVFADPLWRSGPVTGVAVHGVPGLLLIPDRDVEVLVQPNRERVVFDRDDNSLLDPEPVVLLAGMTPADPDEQRARDAAARPEPPPGEQDLYVSGFRDPEQRRLHVDGVDGFRMVPLSELPWPNQLFKCELLARAEAVRATYPDDDVSHGPVWPAVNAETFGSLAEADFAACPYHRPDWAAVAAACRDALAAGPDTADMCAALRADPRIPEGQLGWAEAVFTDPIIWSNGGSGFVNGQHRSCALRAAGVDAIPVLGRYLPAQPIPDPVDARTDAAARVDAFWRSEAAAQYGDRWWARFLTARAAAGSGWARRVLRHTAARKSAW